MNEWKQKWVKQEEKPKNLEDDMWNGFKSYWQMEKTKATSAKKTCITEGATEVGNAWLRTMAVQRLPRLASMRW